MFEGFTQDALATGCGGSRDVPDKQPIADDSDKPAIETGAAVTLVDNARLVDADGDASNWLTHGRTYDEQRFSPLRQISRDNVGELGLAWYFDVPTRRGMEATPIVVDGRMYVTGSWSIVYALNAATGDDAWIRVRPPLTPLNPQDQDAMAELLRRAEHAS